ncbi:hypothetical protein D9M72_327880 [compost metagenome]
MSPARQGRRSRVLGSTICSFPMRWAQSLATASASASRMAVELAFPSSSATAISNWVTHGPPSRGPWNAARAVKPGWPASPSGAENRAFT